MVGGQLLAYPVQEASSQALWHDGVYRDGQFEAVDPRVAERTLVVASCDPAACLLASEYARTTAFRMVVLGRSSREALHLLAQGVVHMAGVHLGSTTRSDENRASVRQIAGAGYRLLRVARWEEGLAVSQHVQASTVQSLVSSRLRWVGREEGSGARVCLDQILSGRPAPRHVARDHRGVAQAIAHGWADAGVCVRLTSEEAGLRFLRIRQEYYDLCFPAALEVEPRVAALITMLRSASVRRMLGDLPGYECRQTGGVRDA
jgi:molybdate-binding protein